MVVDADVVELEDDVIDVSPDAVIEVSDVEATPDAPSEDAEPEVADGAFLGRFAEAMGDLPIHAES